MLQRLSDYFSYWKLKVLLGLEINEKVSKTHTPHMMMNRDRNQQEELELDFSKWHKEIEADEVAR